MSTISARVCPRCAEALPAGAPEGLCPRCVFARLGDDRAATDATCVVNVRAEAAAQFPLEGRKSQVFGDYELLEEIARGGMGVVYKARQKSLNRIVAVKMILAGEFAGKQVTRRFQGEATAAAVLQHPNIVTVHEVGVHQGLHFFSMDYVQGQNLSQLVGARPLPPLQAARYVKIVAHAIHYAHGQGILHRDLKPSNVLVDAAGDEPRVTDFGLARRLEGESSLTISGQVLGSPHFMPPEQASGSRGKVGRPSDVFGLGAILYYLLTARAPFQGETLERVIEQVLHADPVSPRLLNPAVSLDLETICLKCLEKEPDRRYAQALQVAEELERVLKDEPIRARPAGRLEKAWRWSRRNPVISGLAGATAVLLLTVAIGAPIAAVRIAHGRAQLQQNLYFNRITLAHREVLANRPADAQTLLDVCPDSLRGWEWNYVRRRCYVTSPPPMQASGRIRAFVMHGPNMALLAGSEVQLWKLLPSGGFEFQFVLESIPRVPLASEPVSLAFSSNGLSLAVVGTNFTVSLWDVERRTHLRDLVGHTNFVTGVAFHPKDNEIATSSYDRSVRIWDPATGREIRRLPLGQDRAVGLAYSPDGKLLAAGAYGKGRIRVWNTGTWTKRSELVGHLGPTSSLAFSPDSQLLASTSSDDSAIRLWNILTGKSAGLLESESRAAAGVLAFNPAGTYLLATREDREIGLWKMSERREVLSLSGHTNVPAAIFTENGEKIVSAGIDGLTVRLWDASPLSKEELPDPVTLQQHTYRVVALAFGHDSQTLYSAALNGLGMMWNLSKLAVVNQFGALFDLAVSADGKYVVSAGGDLETGKLDVQLFDSTSLRQRFSRLSSVEFFSADLSPSGEQLAAVDAHGELYVWEWKKNDQGQRFTCMDESAVHVRFSPDGHWLAVADGMGTVKLLDASHLSGRMPPRELLHGEAGRSFPRIAFSHDGRRLASGDGFKDVLVMDVPSGNLAMRLTGHGAIVQTVAFGPNGRWLASGDGDGTVRLWDAAKGSLVRVLPGHRGAVMALAFSPDGKRLASAGDDHTIKLWPLQP